jgi:hypothetical protein
MKAIISLVCVVMLSLAGPSFGPVGEETALANPRPIMLEPAPEPQIGPAIPSEFDLEGGDDPGGEPQVPDLQDGDSSVLSGPSADPTGSIDGLGLDVVPDGPDGPVTPEDELDDPLNPVLPMTWTVIKAMFR